MFIEIEGFLHPNLCNYLINFFENNKDQATTYNWRNLIKLNENTNDPVIESVIKPKYQKIHPKAFLSNIEIVKWPVGEYHDWHDDTAHYDSTSITYLNDEYEGGKTQIEDYIVDPKTGKIVLFDSSKQHRVSPLETNVRYVLAVWYNKKNKT